MWENEVVGWEGDGWEGEVEDVGELIGEKSACSGGVTQFQRKTSCVESYCWCHCLSSSPVALTISRNVNIT